MNIRTSTDIDRAISAAEALHDDQVGQVGSRRPAPQRPSAGLLDSQPGDAALDVVADEDLAPNPNAWKAARIQARKAFRSSEFIDLEDNIREACCTAELALLALQHYVKDPDRCRLTTLEFAVDRARDAAFEVDREYQTD